jgi:DNA-binding MarR family transcriptional regulator
MNFAVSPIEESPGFIAHRTDMLMKLGLTRAFKMKGYHITPEQWGLLGCLWETEGINQRELAERALKDRPNITRILNLLEKNELIKRVPHPDDKRSVLVYLTKLGKNLQKELTPIVIHFLEECFKNVPEQKYKDFIAVHRQIARNLKSL